MTYNETVDVDARNDHPTIVFFQDRATRATLAVAADGSLPWVGYHGPLPLDEVPQLENAAREYRAHVLAR